MEIQDLPDALEALLFVATEPLGLDDLQRTIDRALAESMPDAAARQALLDAVPAAFAAVRARWHHAERGFGLIEVAGGVAFRSHPRFAPLLLAMRETRPLRLSKAAMETLAIVAYRQPITRPEADQIRGVDCGGALRALLERHLIKVVGKRDEVGRPLLYGTTRDFLNTFNLADLSQLPTLREFEEMQASRATPVVDPTAPGAPSLQELATQARALTADDAPAIAALDAAVQQLGATEAGSREALAAEGIVLAGGEAESATP